MITRMKSGVLKRQKILDHLISGKSNAEGLSMAMARTKLRQAKATLRQYIRAKLSDSRNRRNESLSTIFSVNPSAAYKAIQSSKEAVSSDIQNLKEGTELYSGNKVPDGFYDSLLPKISRYVFPIFLPTLPGNFTGLQ